MLVKGAPGHLFGLCTSTWNVYQTYTPENYDYIWLFLEMKYFINSYEVSDHILLYGNKHRYHLRVLFGGFYIIWIGLKPIYFCLSTALRRITEAFIGSPKTPISHIVTLWQPMPASSLLCRKWLAAKLRFANYAAIWQIWFTANTLSFATWHLTLTYNII